MRFVSAPFAAVSIALLVGAFPARAEDAAAGDVESELRRFSTIHHVNITLPTRFPIDNGDYELEAKPAMIGDVKLRLPVLSAELAIYPAELIERSRLQSIALCDDMTQQGQQVGGVTPGPRRTVYLDVNSVRVDDAHLRRYLHHEFFHMLEYTRGTLNRDDPWKSLNPLDFNYDPKRYASIGDGVQLT